MSVLLRAILSNKPADVRAALADGCDVNVAVSGHTPLFHAVGTANTEVLEILLKHGADWRKRDRVTGWSPLMMATINRYRSARRHFSGRAIKESKRVVKMLVSAGAIDPETEMVLGNQADEAGLVASVIDRGTRADAPALVLDGAVVLIPPRMTKKSDPAAFYTIEEQARKLNLLKLARALVRA
jgi:hypothetical protein